MAAGNKNLNSAKTARKDEFYTQLTDIEKEMRYYRKHFKDKTGDGGVDMLDVAELFKSRENELTELKGDGDFRSPECLELLDEADTWSRIRRFRCSGNMLLCLSSIKRNI